MFRHSLLFNYSLPEDGGDFAPEDPEANLIPGLVEKAALPILRHEIAHCWDMLSLQETRNAVSATALVINYVPTCSEALGELLVAIQTRLADTVANLVVVILYPPIPLLVIFFFNIVKYLLSKCNCNSQFTGHNLESSGTEGGGKCCKTCGILFWHVCSSDEEYQFVERNSCTSSFGEAGS